MVLYSAMIDDDFADKLMTAMEKYAPFEGEHSCELVCHVETESGNVHILLLKKNKVVYTPELLQFLRKELGIQKVWVSNRAKR